MKKAAKAATLKLTYNPNSGVVKVTEGGKRASRSLPRAKIPKYCCDAESMTGTCSAPANIISSWASPKHGIVVIEYAHGMNAADGCEHQGGTELMRLR